MKYDNILNDFDFKCSRAKVKVTVAIFRKHCHRSSTLFMDRFCCNFTQMSSMENILIKFTFQLSRTKVNVKVAILRNVLLAVRYFHLWTDFDKTSYIFWVWQHPG